MLQSKSRWIVKQSDQEKADELVKGLNITSLVASLLVNRGIDTVESARYFLFDKEQHFHDPFLLKGMDLAVDRIKKAINGGEPIMVFGDYDADGVTSTTVMMTVLQDLGADVQFYIPNRFTEGYGPNAPAFQYAADIGIQLIITVDTGISAVNEAKVAKELGLDLIITDHHEPGPELPEALAIIHPKLPESAYPFRDLAGVGVAFKLAHALYGKIPEHLLEIAAIGTIADLVPLKDENRLIAKAGINRLKATGNLGLKALLKKAGTEQSAINEDTIGFFLAPRLNAAGRLDSADPAVELLLTDDPYEAEAIADEIDQMNKTRQQIVSDITEEAIMEAEALFSEQDYSVIVVGKEGWNAGVIGIVASRLVEKYYRPVIVLSFDKEKGLAKGSARSITGFDLFQNLTSCKDILPHFGGHPGAAGMTLNLDDVDELRKRLNEQAVGQLSEEDFIPVTMLDQEVEIQDVSISSIEEMSLLAPYGMENPKPKILLNEISLASIRKIGANQDHLKLQLEDEGKKLDGIAFRLGHLADQISSAAKLSVIGELSINEWNNIRKPQIFVQDIAVHEWQLFDMRGAKHFEKFVQTLPEERLKWIVFQENTKEKFANMPGELIAVSSIEQAKELAIDGDNIVLADFPLWKEQLTVLLEGKKPARIYAHFHKESDAFFSTDPAREHFKWFYAFLLKRGSFDSFKNGDDLAKYKGWSRDTIDFISQVFFELDFVKIDNGVITLNQNVNKRDLTDSKTYQQRGALMELERDLLYASSTQLKEWFNAVMVGTVQSEEEMGNNGLETIHHNR